MKRFNENKIKQEWNVKKDEESKEQNGM